MTSKSTYEEPEERVQVLEDKLADHKRQYGSEQLKRQYLEAILNNTNLCIYLKDAEYKSIFMIRGRCNHINIISDEWYHLQQL
jgi:hypothetical protein